MHRLSFVVAVLVLLVNLISSATPSSFTFHHRRPSSLTALNDATCPPCSCFNCLTSPYKCLNFGTCAKSNGKCDCSPGLGGDDCGTPLCGSLASDNRPQKIPGKACDCDAGWTGMNCNGTWIFSRIPCSLIPTPALTIKIPSLRSRRRLQCIHARKAKRNML